MKKSTIFSLMLIAIILVQAPLFAQWVQTNGPYGANVSCMAASGSTIFAGTRVGGLFRSTDYGSTWSSVQADMRDVTYWTYQVQALVIADPYVFAGTSHGVFRSTNNGTNWTEVNSGIINTNTSDLIVSGSDLIYADDDSVFYSTNNGDSWTSLNSANASYALYCLASIDTSIFAGTPNGVYRFSKAHPSWTYVSHGLSGSNVYCLLVDGNNLFAGTEGGVSLSTDMGDNWTPINTGLTYSYIYDLVKSGAYIFAADNYNGVFRTGSYGAGWTQVNTDLTNTRMTALCASGSYIFSGSQGGDGVFRSTNDGTGWSVAKEGLSNTIVNSVTSMPNGSGGTDILAGTSEGVFRTSDGGTNWIKVSSGLTNVYVQALYVSGTNLFAGTNDGLFRSRNNGDDWTDVSSGLTKTDVNAIVGLVKATGDTILFAATDGGGVFRADNNEGTGWTVMNTGISSKYLRALAVKDSTVYVAGPGIYRSTNYGANWIKSDTGLTFTNVYTLAFAQNGAKFFAGTYNGGVFRSTNSGSSWTQASTGFPGYPTVRSITASGTNTFAAVEDYGVFLSTNNGTRWTEVNTDIPHPNIYSLLISGSDMYAGSIGGGVAKRPLSDMITSVEDHPAGLPSCHCLYQNYPNPFNPTTTITFTLAEPGHVSLKIFDVLGREVATLVNRQLNAAVLHQVTLDASRLSTGMYFYRLESGNNVQAKKLMILK